ncbi:MAG: hypothetical protein Q9218_008295 [Villophora microphyllina]
MEGSPQHGESPTFPSFGAACETCHWPDMSNMTWGDGIKHFWSTIFATPRMWPIGYIMDSPYSPLRLERELPSSNWRDAFEDLLALEVGGAMIPVNQRVAEDVYAAHLRFLDTSDTISKANLMIQKRQSLRKKFQWGLQIAVKSENVQFEEIHRKLLASLDRDVKEVIDYAQGCRDTFEKLKDSTASSQKARGQWIASMINNGALPTWIWRVNNSLYGRVFAFDKLDAPPELDAGLVTSEFELQQIFEQGAPHEFGQPTELPLEEVEAIVTGAHVIPWVDVPGDPNRDFRPSQSSVMTQAVHTKSKKQPDGSTITKVLLTNTLADGTTVSKEFEQEPVKLLEEMDNAKRSMKLMHEAVMNMSKPHAASHVSLALQEMSDQLDAVSV